MILYRGYILLLVGLQYLLLSSQSPLRKLRITPPTKIRVPGFPLTNLILMDLHDIVAESQDVNGFLGVISGVELSKVDNIALTR